MSLELENQLQVCGLHPVIQEAIVADLLKTARQHMHQVTADKFRLRQSDGPFGVARFPAPGGEGNFRICYRKDSAVGDGDFMCVSPKILDGIAKTVKGFLYVRAPVHGIQAVLEILPFIGIAEGFAGRGKSKPFFPIQGIQHGKIFSPELIPQHRDGDEKVFLGCPDFPVRRQAPAGNNTMHMDMVIQFLVPGVKHLDNAGYRAKVSGIGRKFQERLGTAFVEKAVKAALVAGQKRV